MGGYLAYPEYKESGVEWLGKIPAHWESKRLRFLVLTNPSKNEIRLEENESVSFIPMEAVGEYGGLDLETEKALAEISGGYTYFAEGDVVLAKITPCFENGKSAVAQNLTNKVAFGTTELHVLRANDSLDNFFLFYLTISQVFRKLGEAEMYGAGGQKRVPESFIRDFCPGIPPLKEQQQIATFLDYKTAQIDALIAKKEALLEKLAEKRTALISQAVTKGLDPTVPMKDSGIEWLGEIPAHWEILQIKRAFVLQRGVDITKAEQVDGEVPVVSSGGVFSYHDVAYAKAPGVVVGRKGSLGTVHYILQDYWPHDTTLWVIDFFGNHSRYVYYKLLSMNLESWDTGSANPTLNRNLIHPLKTSWPPFKEQIQISEKLDEITDEMEQQSRKIDLAISKLQEYRAALITNAVTGKIDVRDIKLPNPTPAEANP